LTGSAAVLIRSGAKAQVRLNLPAPWRDQQQALRRGGDDLGDLILMKSVRPNNADPIPLRTAPPRIGTIIIRFVGLLVVAVVVLTLIWNR
jgi:hypothetical protein